LRLSPKHIVHQIPVRACDGFHAIAGGNELRQGSNSLTQPLRGCEGFFDDVPRLLAPRNPAERDWRAESRWDSRQPGRHPTPYAQKNIPQENFFNSTIAGSEKPNLMQNALKKAKTTFSGPKTQKPQNISDKADPACGTDKVTRQKKESAYNAGCWAKSADGWSARDYDIDDSEIN
jgi:hypothetical protein